MAVARKNRGRWLGRLNKLWMLAAVLCGLGGLASAAHAGYAAIVVDSTTGEVLNEVNADEQNYPASLSKMMTLYLAFQALQTGKLKLDQQLPVTAWAANKAPTKLDLRNGQTISVRDCILGMITKSANDAATVMAEGLGGTETGFAALMNAQARRLGMTNTHFDNASGLPDPYNLSTARDLVKLAMALYRDFPEQSHYFATKQFVFRGQVVRGHNELMDRYPGMDGLKTGFTNASGFNLASTAVRDGHRLFAVVLGGSSAAARDRLMARLLDDGFDGRQTPATLVAAVAGSRPAGPSMARRVLAALSPVETAEAADAVPASKLHRRGKAARAGHAVTARAGAKAKAKPRAAAATAAKQAQHGRRARGAHGSVKLADKSHAVKKSRAKSAAGKD